MNELHQLHALCKLEERRKVFVSFCSWKLFKCYSSCMHFNDLQFNIFHWNSPHFVCVRKMIFKKILLIYLWKCLTFLLIENFIQFQFVVTSVLCGFWTIAPKLKSGPDWKAIDSGDRIKKKRFTENIHLKQIDCDILWKGTWTKQCLRWSWEKNSSNCWGELHG